MKPTSEILERIEKCSSEHKDGVFTRLYRYLLREDIYYAAYQKLYANKGATTQGIDNDTADGFSDFYVKELMCRACMRRNLPLIPELIAAISPTMTRKCWKN